MSNTPTTGSATVTINASKGTTKERTGHVIVSESVTYKGTTITLQNKIEVTQDIVGMVVRPGIGMTLAKISEEMLNKSFKGMTIEIYPIAFLVICPPRISIESP